MKRSRRTKSLTISNSRWFAYATAGAATALGAASPAEAEIHYSGQIGERFDLFHLGVRLDVGDDAMLNFRHYFTHYAFYFSVGDAAVSGPFRGSFNGIWHYVSRLSSRIPVSDGEFFGAPPQSHALGLLGTSYGIGRWAPFHNAPHKVGYIGFLFDNSSGKQYGWVRLKVRPSNHIPFFGVVVLDYAWADPGEPILTGQANSSGEMVDALPLDGSLGLLAAGGTGLDAWRKERAKSVKNQP